MRGLFTDEGEIADMSSLGIVVDGLFRDCV